jgi:tetratricopeptide (TPR) repeat protein
MLQGQYPLARSGLEQLVSRYGNSSVTPEAYLLLGDLELDMGNPEGARRSFAEALSRAESPMIVRGAKAGLAAVLTNQEQWEEASRLYEELAGSDGESVIGLDNLMSAAHAAREGGDLERARSLYEQAYLLADQVDRARQTQIKTNLAELEVLRAPPGESLPPPKPIAR